MKATTVPDHNDLDVFLIRCSDAYITCKYYTNNEKGSSVMKVEWKSCLRVGISLFLLYLGITYWPSFTSLLRLLATAAMPLLIGCVIAYIINILMSFYEKHYFPKSKNAQLIKSRRIICMLAAFISLVIIVVLLFKLVVPELVSCVELLIAQIPGVVNALVDWLETVDIVPQDILSALQNIN